MSGTTTYDTSVPEISYKDNAEYRAAFRRNFRMTPHAEMAQGEDAETADEMDFDADAASLVMDEIFFKTETNAQFSALYELAAAKMLSLDKTIGMAVLLSYDYFAAFHRCLCVWLQDPSAWNETCPAFVVMYEKIK